MHVGLILEILVAVLLVVTIGYCFVLNRRLAMLRNGQGEMHAAVLTLNQAAEKARISVEQMRQNSISLSEQLSEKIKSGRAIVEELGMMVESGNSIADRLAGTSTAIRSPERAPNPLDALPRLDEGFRRQVERDNEAPREPEMQKSNLSGKQNYADSDLRVALRAMR